MISLVISGGEWLRGNSIMDEVLLGSGENWYYETDDDQFQVHEDGFGSWLATQMVYVNGDQISGYGYFSIGSLDEGIHATDWIFYGSSSRVSTCLHVGPLRPVVRLKNSAVTAWTKGDIMHNSVDTAWEIE